MMKKAVYFCEAALLYVFFALCRALPLDAASGMGGWIGRAAGPRMAASRKALANLALALPELDETAHRRILHGMWDNLGRVMAEYPHLDEIARTRVDLRLADGATLVPDHAIYISGHIANWEVPTRIFAGKTDKTVGAIYRAPNNPWVDRLLDKARGGPGLVETYPKSKAGTRKLFKALEQGRIVGVLIDQKYNEGIAVPFFGHLAMTGAAFVPMARKFGCQIVPCRMERTGGAHFRETIYAPLRLDHPDGTARTDEDVILDAHALLEQWITERPEDWLWLHRRWPGEEKRQRLEAARRQATASS